MVTVTWGASDDQLAILDGIDPQRTKDFEAIGPFVVTGDGVFFRWGVAETWNMDFSGPLCSGRWKTV